MKNGIYKIVNAGWYWHAKQAVQYQSTIILGDVIFSEGEPPHDVTNWTAQSSYEREVGTIAESCIKTTWKCLSVCGEDRGSSAEGALKTAYRAGSLETTENVRITVKSRGLQSG